MPATAEPPAASLDRVALGALPFFAANSVSATLGAALFARWMDGEAFGGFVFAVHVLGLVSLVGGMGFPQGAVRFLPRYVKRGEGDLYRGFLATGLGVQVAGGLLAGGLAWAAVALLGAGGHSTAALSEAWWLAPVLALNVFLASVDKSAGRIRISALEHGALRHGLAVVLGLGVVVVTGALPAQAAIRVFGAAAALTVAVQAVGRWLAGDRLVPRRLDLSPWFRVSASLALLWGMRILGTSGEVLILRLVIGETTAGAFHLATVWAALVAVPALTFTAAASRLIAGVEGEEARRLADLSVRRAILPTVLAAAVVLPLAAYFLDHPDATHRLAESLLLPLVAVWALRGLEAAVFSGLALRGLQARATRLASGLTFVSLAVSVGLAFVGPLAVAWGVLVVRVTLLIALLRAERRGGSLNH